MTHPFNGQVPACRAQQNGTSIELYGITDVSKKSLLSAMSHVARKNWSGLTKWAGSYWVLVTTPSSYITIGDLAGCRPVYVNFTKDKWSIRSADIAFSGIDYRLSLPSIVLPPLRLGEIHPTSYEGVSRVLPGVATIADRKTGQIHLERFWQISFGTDDVTSSGQRLLRELTNSMKLRAATGAISSDLSGGYDSTSVAMIASRFAEIEAVTIVDKASANDEDVRLAALAAKSTSNIRHFLTEAHHSPYDFLHQAPWTDQPFSDAASWEMRKPALELASARGSQLHLTGSAGDVVFSSSPHHLLELARHKAMRNFFRQSHAWAQLRHVSPSQVALQAAFESGKTQTTLLKSLKRDIEVRPGSGFRSGRNSLRWLKPSKAASWFTEEGRATVRACIDRYIDQSSDRNVGAWLMESELWEFGAYQRELDDQNTSIAVSTSTPFLDNNVIQAVTSLPWHLRQDEKGMKKQLVAAVDSILPQELLNRSSKCSYSATAYSGVRRNYDHLRSLLSSSGMVSSGLLNRDAIIASLDVIRNGAPGPFAALDSLISFELWAQSATARQNREP